MRLAFALEEALPPFPLLLVEEDQDRHRLLSVRHSPFNWRCTKLIAGKGNRRLGASFAPW